MDSELEICRREDIFVSWILTRPSNNKSKHSRVVLYDSVDTSIGAVCTRIHFLDLQTAFTPGTTKNIPSRHASFHINSCSQLLIRGYVVCTKSALPILCIHRVVNALLTMEIWYESFVDLCCMGSARMGMERISKHRDKFHGCGSMSGYTGVRCLVGYSQRLRRRQRSDRPRRRSASTYRMKDLPIDNQILVEVAATVLQNRSPQEVASCP